jgi:tetratricopeptide (TPR) repeat protein
LTAGALTNPRRAKKITRGDDAVTDASRRAWLAGILAAATLAVFAPVLGHQFLPYDDHVYVTTNRHVLGGLSAADVRWALTATDGGSWHPLTWWSHQLDVQLFGGWAGGHHLTSALLHTAAATTLFLVLAGMTGALWPSWFTAFLFALHPLHVESVAWVAERKDVLAGLFWVLALAAYLAYVRRPRLGALAVVVACFVLGVLSKPIVVTFPIVCLLLDYWPLGRSRALSLRDAARLLREKAGLLLLAAAAGFLALKTQSGAYAFEDIGSVASSFRSVMLSTSLANAVSSYVVYLGKTLWPASLAVFYPYPAHALRPAAGAAALAVLAAVSAAVVLLRRRPYLATGWLWYLATLLPVIGLLQVGSQARADRYTYLPLTGVFLATAWGARDVGRQWPRLRPAIWCAAALAIAAAPVLTSRQLAHWRTGETLFEHAIDVTADNYLAHQILGDTLRLRGDFARAEGHYRQVLALRPRYPGAQNSLGLALSGQGRLDEAVAAYRAAALQAPGDPQPLNNLGVDLTALGRLAEAETCLHRALEIAPGLAEIHANLGDALALQGRTGEAARSYEKALELNPGLQQARERLERLRARRD